MAMRNYSLVEQIVLYVMVATHRLATYICTYSPSTKLQLGVGSALWVRKKLGETTKC